MTAEKTTIAFPSRLHGSRVYGLGVMAVAIVSLVWRDFDPGQPVPRSIPHRTALACVAAVFMLFAATAVEWRRTRRWGAAALTAYYALIVLFLMNGRVLLTHYSEYGTYEGIAEQLAITAGALIVYATAERHSKIGDSKIADSESARRPAARLIRLGQIAFGVCALIFGGAHFVYMDLTAPLVPKWLPPSQLFWGYATGVCFIAAGVALVTGIRARLAAIMLTAMIGIFGMLVNGPILLANHASHGNWTESAINLAIAGAAWVVADSLARPATVDQFSRIQD